MTVTYDITTDVGKVRLMIGDNILTSYKFTNEEIGYFLSSNSNNINLAAADALEAWASAYATNADTERIGDYSYSQGIVKKMLDLAAKLREKDSSVPLFDIASMNLTGIVEE